MINPIYRALTLALWILVTSVNTLQAGGDDRDLGPVEVLDIIEETQVDNQNKTVVVKEVVKYEKPSEEVLTVTDAIVDVKEINETIQRTEVKVIPQDARPVINVQPKSIKTVDLEVEEVVYEKINEPVEIIEVVVEEPSVDIEVVQINQANDQEEVVVEETVEEESIVVKKIKDTYDTCKEALNSDSTIAKVSCFVFVGAMIIAL